MIRIDDALSIPESELRFMASRGGGPGGQHVNKVASRVTLQFDVGASATLTEEQRTRIMQRLASRISKEGVLRMSSHAQRSQAANRAALVERFARVMGEALRPRKSRARSGPPRVSRRRRLESKRRRAEIKRRRGKVPGGEE